jgi:hypothetical protein
MVVALNGTARSLFAHFRSLPVTLTVTLTSGAPGPPTLVADKTLTIVGLNTVAVAHSIEKAILFQRHIHATVTCPAAVIQAKGNHFTCIATDWLGKGPHKRRITTPFAATVVNDNGYVTFSS